MTTKSDELLLDVLRAAGHSDAAAIAATVLESREAPASDKTPSEPAARPGAAPTLMAAPANEAERRAEGASLLTAMKRDLNLDDDFTPRRPSVPPAEAA